MFKLSCCKLYHKSKMGILKPYFTQQLLANSSVHSSETRQANDIHQTNVTTTIQSQLINSKISSSWNELPHSLKTRNFCSTKSLSNTLKKHYLSKYPAICSIKNCYICNRNDWLTLPWVIISHLISSHLIIFPTSLTTNTSSTNTWSKRLQSLRL